jgi:polyhydroxyalkanoate synthesis regulator phasin
MDATNRPTPPTTDPAPAEKSPYRPNRLTSGIVAGGAAFAMVLAGLGIASAQTDEGSTTTEAPAASAPAEGEGAGRPHGGHHHHALAATFLGLEHDELRTQLEEGKTLADIAGARTDDLVAALVADGEKHLDDAVVHGRLTQAEADEKKAELPERMTAFVNATLPAEGERGGPEGPGGPGGKHGGPGGRPSLGTVASTLGITEDELRTQLQSGKTLADIAGDKTPAVIDALVAEATARIDQAVTDGKLTAEQATERKADLTERITAMVNRTPPAPGEGRGHRHGPPPAEGETEAAPASVDA